jgi:hypothetical protein
LPTTGVRSISAAEQPESRGRASGGSLKGQMWSLDFTIGLIALGFILMMYILMWNTIAVRWNSAASHTKMESSAYFAAESLLATPGEPESWEMLARIDGNVSAIGLVNGRNELNNMKLGKLVSENATGYQTIKNRLGLERYELGMRVISMSGNSTYYEFGKFSQNMQNNSLSFDRLGILNGTPVIVHMEVWGG